MGATSRREAMLRGGDEYDRWYWRGYEDGLDDRAPITERVPAGYGDSYKDGWDDGHDKHQAELGL